MDEMQNARRIRLKKMTAHSIPKKKRSLKTFKMIVKYLKIPLIQKPALFFVTIFVATLCIHVFFSASLFKESGINWCNNVLEIPLPLAHNLKGPLDKETGAGDLLQHKKMALPVKTPNSNQLNPIFISTTVTEKMMSSDH